MQPFIKKLNVMVVKSMLIKTLVKIVMVSTLCFISVGLLSGISTRALSVEIIDQGESVKSMLTNARSWSEVLVEAGVQTSEFDEITVELSDAQHAVVSVQRAFMANVQADGTVWAIPMVRGTAQDALNSANLALGKDDFIKLKNHSADSDYKTDVLTELNADASIEVVRVTYNTISESQEIPFTSTTIKTSKLDKGLTQVESEGQNGQQYFSTTQVLHNGVIVNEETVTFYHPPVEEIILEGTYVKPIIKPSVKSGGQISTMPLPASVELDADGIPVNYSKVISGRGVAYTAPAGARTATGATVRPGIVAVNPNTIPYGTKMYIVSQDGYVYGYCIAADTGGSCMKGTILVDLFMDTLEGCYSWGSRTVNVYILD